jgi:hypothetical protein
MLPRKVLLVFGEAALIGAQKATIAERLVRSEGNDGARESSMELVEMILGSHEDLGGR